MSFTSSSSDNRGDGYNPIARKNAGSVDHSGLTTSQIMHANGEVSMIIYSAPSLTTDTTFDIDILDEDDVVLYAKTGNAHNSKGKIVVNSETERLALYGAHKVKITTANSQTNAIFYIAYVLAGGAGS